MSSSSYISKLKTFLTPNSRCGCRPKPADILEPHHHRPSSGEAHHHHHKTVVALNTVCPKIRDSLAVVKDSDDPYRDFRQSMLQMIFEREIYSAGDLQHLLHCFLHLNSSRHHEIIIRAFSEIWNDGAAAREVAESPIPVGCSGEEVDCQICGSVAT